MICNKRVVKFANLKIGVGKRKLKRRTDNISANNIY